jgi:hypothetical protein
MNDMDLVELYKVIKKSFCDLTSYKVRGNVLELITAFTTLNGRFVSVFVKFEKDKIVVTDGGWIDSNYYENPIYDESEEIIKRVIGSYLTTYDIKTTTDKTGVTYYYKTANDVAQLASIVFDLANYIVGAVNSYCIHFKDEKEEKERETFRKDANTFLKEHYNDNVQLRKPLDDFGSIKFNAIINKGSNLYLITYITGSTPYYFENDIRKTIVNFEITERSKYKDIIKEKISIINNQSDGFHPERYNSILDLLKEKSTKEPINWTEKEKLLEYV